MPLSTQFELGLEFTNVFNPISQAVSALGSLAVVDAIKKSGSDVITELKLASLIGRHRIDPIIAVHFREAVSKSDQSIISRYMDIVLESGAGPTVQEAMKNPALFSMILQLSGLAFAHEDEPLADAFVEAIETNMRESGRRDDAVPDYVSLLGTLQACRQQTVGFRWAILYEAVERKIHTGMMPKHGPERAVKKKRVETTPFQMPESMRKRSLPFQVLKGLLKCLPSLQRFPKEGLLHLKSSSGISTIVVWCHHILGLSLVVRFRSYRAVRFGDTSISLIIEGSDVSQSSATLMNPVDRHEPIFHLVGNDEHRELEQSSEIRAEAFGYGRAVLRTRDMTEAEECAYSRWIISWSLEATKRLSDDVDSRAESHAMREDPFGSKPGEEYNEAAEEYNLPGKRVPYLSREDIARASAFLFGIESDGLDDTEEVKELTDLRQQSLWRQEDDGLVAILLTLARINARDLPNCAHMPLSVGGCKSIGRDLKKSSIETIGRRIGLLTAFDNLLHLLLGHSFTTEYVRPAVLVSAWGWSMFFDSVTMPDPGDISLDSIRVVCGVPARRGLRRNRIIDGPIDELKAVDSGGWYLQPKFFADLMDISRAQKELILVGLHADAFQVTQDFKWTSGKFSGERIQLGFREMQENLLQFEKLSTCPCDKAHSKFLIQVRTRGEGQISDRYFWKARWRQEEPPGVWFTQFRIDGCDYESINTGRLTRRPKDHRGEIMRIASFYATQKFETRWLQLTHLCAAFPTNVSLALRSHDTCMDCAMKMIVEQSHPIDRTWLLL